MSIFLLAGAGVMLVAIALHVAWVAKRAEAKGRSALAWVALGLVLAAVGVRAGFSLLENAASAGNDALMALFATAPLTLGLAGLIAIVLVLNALPVHVALGMAWPVFEKQKGAGKLVIEEDAIELRWQGTTQRILRAGLTAQADQESLRLTWNDGELLVMPTGKPATRDGRVMQAQTLAARLSS
jgi:hypothetical protein